MPTPSSPSFDWLLSQSRLTRLEARILMEKASARSREWLIAHGDETPSPAVVQRFEALCERRQRGEPIAYLIGEREFFGRRFGITPDVLIPRPETELLIERALLCLPPAARVIDLGTGSGCIVVTLACERPDLLLLATDHSAAALAVALANARQHCPELLTEAGPRGLARLSFVLSDWWQGLADSAPFDLIVSNPPYIGASDPHLAEGDLRFEPRDALTDAADGLSALTSLIAGAPARLSVGGRILLEHGFDQGPAVRRLLGHAGFSEVTTVTDSAGLDRVTEGRWLALP